MGDQKILSPYLTVHKKGSSVERQFFVYRLQYKLVTRKGTSVCFGHNSLVRQVIDRIISKEDNIDVGIIQ